MVYRKDESHAMVTMADGRKVRFVVSWEFKDAVEREHLLAKRMDWPYSLGPRRRVEEKVRICAVQAFNVEREDVSFRQSEADRADLPTPTELNLWNSITEAYIHDVYALIERNA